MTSVSYRPEVMRLELIQDGGQFIAFSQNISRYEKSV
jgi:hypothetical protein